MSRHGLGQLFIIGGGGHAWVVTEAARAAGWTVLGFFDDDPSATVDHSTPRVGPIQEAPGHAAHPSETTAGPIPSIIAIGTLATRERILRDLRGLFARVIHPSSIVSSSAKLGEGIFVSAAAVIQGRAVIGDHAIVNTGAIVEHDCVLGRNVHVAPRATLGGGVHVGEHTLIGLGASVRPGVRIGNGCTIGVGAAVIRDVLDGQTVIGVPAKPSEWMLEGESG